VEYNSNNTRDGRSLPAVAGKLDHFVAAWVQYPRIQYGNTTTWYSPTIPEASFLICKPVFEQVLAKVTIDPNTQNVLAYELLEPLEPVEGASYFDPLYQDDGNTSVSAGVGAAFMLRALLGGWSESAVAYQTPDVVADFSTWASMSVLNNENAMVEGDNLARSVEMLFPAYFSQWSTIPGNVFVNSSVPLHANGEITVARTRIIVSTTAMVIVVTVLVIMVVALVALPWWTRSWEKTLVGMKREPDVMGAVLGYLCDSENLLGLFQGQHFGSMKELEVFLKGQDKEVKLGRFVGEDGETYFGIETVEGTEWVGMNE